MQPYKKESYSEEWKPLEKKKKQTPSKYEQLWDLFCSAFN